MLRHVSTYLLFALVITSAQEPPFRVQTKVVQIPVSVTNQNGGSVDGLSAQDFTVLDNGIRQADVTLDDFSTGLAPISIGIVIQTSAASKPALVKISSIGGMIQPLIVGERGAAAVVTFDQNVRWLQDFTSDDIEIRSALKNLRASRSGEARMIDAIAEVADRLKERNGRRILLVIGESRDRGSDTGFQKVRELIERESIEVFGIHYSAYATAMVAKPEDLPESSPMVMSGDPNDWPPSPPTVNFLAIGAELARLASVKPVEVLAQLTGGFDDTFIKETALQRAIGRIGTDVHSQYVLSFPQLKPSRGIHQLEVTVPANRGVRIRSRRTYLAD
ncbi:MAG TPA: VWA domain-containing protein [Bryobacteraceae bacterium]|jgi:VWFA-related protein